MARPRTIPDATILAAVRRLFAAGGEKAVAFSAVAEASGLAPASLAQRYGSVQGMIETAAADAVDQALSALATIEAATPDKGPQGLLKHLSETAPDAASLAVLIRSANGRAKLASYRSAVEGALQRRLGPKASESAAMIFALWQGQALWDDGNAAPFKVKDALKRLG